MGGILSHLYIYGDNSSGVNLNDAIDYIRGLLPDSEIEPRKDFFEYYLNPEILDSLTRKLAGIKVLDPIKERLNTNPIYGEIDYERRKILNPSTVSIGVMYDGFRMQAILYPLIRKEEKGQGHLHIVLTNQLVVTWEGYDMRYHLRVGVYGQPSIISISGIVEAPAKPREFYILKHMLGINPPFTKGGQEGDYRNQQRFIDYEDPRITDVLKGYLAQAIFYHISGDPFCDDRGCRLFNAHWQEEMIYAQIESPYEFCDRHVTYLKNHHPPLHPLPSREGN